MVRDTDGPQFEVKKLKSNGISCFLSPSYLNLLNMHTFTLKYNYLNLFKLPHIYVHFNIFYSVSCDTWDLKIFLYPCKHFGKAVFAICLNISVYSRLFFFQDFRDCIVGGL